MKHYLPMIFIVILVLSGCANSSNELSSKPDKLKEEAKETEKIVKPEEVEVVKPMKKREDNGDYNVTFEGEYQLKDNTITVKGSTNLLPGSKIFFNLDALDGVIIGGADTVLVEEDGSFQLEQKIPSNYDYPSIDAVLTFNSAASNEEITEHYTESGEVLEGPFVRLYEEDDELRKEIKVSGNIPLDQPELTVPIEVPKWEKPADFGSTNVWIDAELVEDEDYIYIKGSSNLLEGSSVRGDLSAEEYILSGYSHRVNTNPDGSFDMVIKNLRKEISDLPGYEVTIEFSPTDPNSLQYIKATYGETGERIQGDFVSNEDGEKVVSITISVQE